MEYLGHELSSEGVRPVGRLVTAVSEFPRPGNPVEVKRFVHLAGYYRKFIEAFGSIMAPLTRLLKKDSVWEWTEEQEFAFERVKAALTTKALLAYPNFELPFRLVTDTSKVGLRACLMQDQGRGWQPVAFASKVNSREEANYSITELERLAVVWAVKLFRPYLWSLTLQEYEFEILYRPGATNVVADALSRAPAAVLAATGRRATRGRRSTRERRTERTARAAEKAGDDSKTEDDDPDHSPTPNDNTETVVETLTMDGGVEMEATTATVPVETPTLTRDGNSSTEMTGGRAEVNRPLTRAAKRRLEAEAAARATRHAADDERRAGSAPDGDDSDTLLSAMRSTVDDANSASARMDDADLRPAVDDTVTASPEADDVDATNECSSTHVHAADTATGGRSAVTTSGTIVTTDGTMERATAASGTRDYGTEPPLRAMDTRTTVTTSGTAPSRR
ncbi:hypothetical protein PR001_g24247 [Phytophthora rubi]|uniref:Reverse transcriptase/retrotransposon-derived protein RNase H-like domain-containing protein n=1 Tax=Phytophthora rubi TaxID=129364 RepID=A0A6A3ILP1_9STRA|nr:hypothetical protein PR001_g24247 [Phytophthora rubi]